MKVCNLISRDEFSATLLTHQAMKSPQSNTRSVQAAWSREETMQQHYAAAAAAVKDVQT